MTSTRSTVGAPRIAALDATRGAAMLFACLTHFAWWLEPAYPVAAKILAEIGMVATPAFMLLSGAVLGLRLTGTGQLSRGLRLELLDRGLFLLTVAHVLIAWSETHRGGDLLQRLVQVNSVDAIGVGCIVMAVLGDRILRQPEKTVGTGIVMILAGWLMASLWHPLTQLHVVMEEISVGQIGGREIVTYACPLVQYLSLYMLGSVLGVYLLRAHRHEHLQALGRRLTLLGCIAMVCATLLHILSVRMLPVVAAQSTTIFRETFSVSVKQPPSPAYLSFFGGAAMVLAGGLVSTTGSARFFGLLAWLSVLGRASLFVFILQYFVIWTLPDWIGITPGYTAPAVFAAEIGLLWFCARVWSAKNGNRLMVVGLRSLAASWGYSLSKPGDRPGTRRHQPAR